MHRLIPVLRRLARRPNRALLTVVQVMLGTAAIALCLSLLQGHVEGLTPPDVFQVISGTPQGESTPLFGSPGVERLTPLVPDLMAVSPYASLNQVQFTAGGQRYQVLGAAYAGPGYASVLQPKVLQGTFYTAADIQRGTTPVVLTDSVARKVFQQSPLGQSVTVDIPGRAPVPGTVVGIIADPEQRAGGATAYLYLPPPAGLALPTLFVRSRPGRATETQAAVLTAVHEVYGQTEAMKRAGGSVYVSRTGDGPLTGQTIQTDPTLLIFSGFGAIMLMISGIGIFSIQMVGTTERTREIGMRRALGASQFDIVAEYLIEAALLSVAGSLLGLGVAAAVLVVVRNVTGPFLFSRGLTFSPAIAVEVLVLVLAIGILLSLYPALQAARLRPTEALRNL